MPTSDEMAAYERRRAKLMSAIWDAEQQEEIGFGIKVDQMLQQIDEADLPVASIRRLVEDLIGDGMLQEFNPFAEQPYPNSVKLTSYGREQVRQWVAQKEQGTEAFPLSYQQVYNYNTTVHGNVSGSNFVSGSSGVTIDQRTQVTEQRLTLATKAEELLEASGITGEDRDDVVADIETLREDSPPPGRLKAALRRLLRWGGGAVAVGATAALSGEVPTLAGQVLSQL